MRAYNVHAAAASDVGGRQNNEDAYLVNERQGLFIVADGMGGHDKGEVASWFSVNELMGFMNLLRGPGPEDTIQPDEPNPLYLSEEELLQYAILAINHKLYQENERNVAKEESLGDSESERALLAYLQKKVRMGTTLVSLFIDGRKAYVVNVGDSRAYRLADGKIRQLTHDHSWVDEQIRLGKLSKAEAGRHEKRNSVTRSIGFRPEVYADVDTITLYPPERFLLCSDGLSNVVTEEGLLALGAGDDLWEACRSLVARAKDLGGRDNITAVLVEILPRWDDDDDGVWKNEDDEMGEVTLF